MTIKHWPLLGCLCLGSIDGFAAEPEPIKTSQQKHGADIYYFGEAAQAGTIVLDANNGFFDKGSFTAADQHDAPSEAEKSRIRFHYSHLVPGKSLSGKDLSGTAHWYLWVPAAGEVRVNVHMKVPQRDAGAEWTVAVDNETKTMVSRAANPDTPQNWTLVFSIKHPGRHKVSLRLASKQIAKSTEIHRIQLTGSAIRGASLIRARWRPAAIHTQYASSTCPETKMWVFETQNVSDYDSYSPITTPFGYFGGSLLADRTAGGNLNFSMWAANRNAKSAPRLAEMPHLLATGNPEAEFGGFGHEGSGVKIRNWEPLRHHPSSIIQALRIDVRDSQATYSGYFFDDRIGRWVLYAVGRRPTKRGESLRMASFCEVPGPADRQRTGDRQRVIRRRGWVLGADDTWHPVDRQMRKIKRGAPPTNQYIAADDDGWFVMATGGVEMFDQKTSTIECQAVSGGLPPYLQPKITKQLFEYPAKLGRHAAAKITSQSATVNFELLDAGRNARATLYYGLQDCLSFVARSDFHATEKQGVIDQMFGKDRVWAAASESKAAQTGVNTFLLSGLSPSTKYYYRLFIKNDAGKVWSFESGNFQTQ